MVSGPAQSTSVAESETSLVAAKKANKKQQKKAVQQTEFKGK
jgi:hypothetical protein